MESNIRPCLIPFSGQNHRFFEYECNTSIVLPYCFSGQLCSTMPGLPTILTNRQYVKVRIHIISAGYPCSKQTKSECTRKCYVRTFVLTVLYLVGQMISFIIMFFKCYFKDVHLMQFSFPVGLIF